MSCNARAIAVGLVFFASSVAVGAVTEGDAARRAVNDLRSVQDRLVLHHPRYDAHWDRGGFQVDAKSGPSWKWTLDEVRLGPVKIQVTRNVAPSADQDRLGVRYDRGAIIERYLLKASTVEQQFVIPKRLSAGGSDLVIDGIVHSAGMFKERRAGWEWRDARGAVTLGTVTVFDRANRRLPARMEVTAERVRLIVDGPALATAHYPVTIDPEVGANDFRISTTGADGDGSEVSLPAVAAGNNEYLVVWAGNDGESEVWGRLINATTGEPIGSQIRISDMGGVGAGTTYTVNDPDVAYNATNNEYLVVWRGDDNVAPLVDGDIEIFGQRIRGGTGMDAGNNDFRISFMGSNGDTASFVDNPAVAWNSTNNQYLVIWSGDDSAISDNETEIWGRILSNTGTSVSADDVRITNVGPDGNTSRVAYEPDVAYDSYLNRYIVIWQGDPDTDNAMEIYGQLVTNSGEKMFQVTRISYMGSSDLSTAFGAFNASVAFNATEREFLVVWSGDDDSVGDDEIEVWGQLGPNGTSAIGLNWIDQNFLISDMGPADSIGHGGYSPAVAWCATGNRWLVVWHGDDATDNDIELWGQLLDAQGAEAGPEFQLTDQGPAGSTSYLVLNADVAFVGTTALIVWRGTDVVGASDEVETYGQFFDTGALSMTLDDFSLSQATVTMSVPDTLTSHEADGLEVRFGGERNLRVAGSSAAGGAVTATVASGSFSFNRPAGSNAEIAVWWDGDNDVGTFEVNSATPIDLTGGGSFSQFTIVVDSSSSASQQLRLIAWTDGTNLSTANFSLPLGGGTLNVPFSAFSLTAGSGADFTAIRAIYLATLSNEGAWAASLSSIAVTRVHPSAATTTITANPTSLTADGSATSSITVQAKDSTGTNLTRGGASVTLQTTRGWIGTVTDHDDGTYTAVLTAGTVVGTATITGTIDAVAIVDDAAVTFTPGPATTLSVDAPATATAGVPFNVTVTARDAYFNTATGYTETVAFSSTATSATLPSNYTFTGADAGVHTFSVTVSSLGNTVLTVTDTMAPGTTGNDTIAVKGNSTTALSSSGSPSLVGQSVTFTATVTSAASGTITGNVTFKDGMTTLGTASISSGVASFTTPSLSQGTHSITAEYAGSANFHASTSNTVSQVVNLSSFGAPALIAATYAGGSNVTVSWTAVADASSYELHRASSMAGGYAFIGATAGTSFGDTVMPGSAYAYKVRAIGAQTSPFSAVDVATAMSFTDPVLSSSVPVKALHLTELRSAVNALRTLASLTIPTYADPTVTGGTTSIKRVHITELRTALDAARSAISLTPITYTDPTITSGTTVVRKEHFIQIRNGTQ